MIWRDSNFAFDWDGLEDDYEYLVTTVGYLCAENERWTCLAQEVLPNGDGFRAVTPIVRDNIVSREVLKPAPTMSLMTSIGADQGG